MKKQNDHLSSFNLLCYGGIHSGGERGKYPFLKGRGKKTHPLEVRLFQILLQNLFNHCVENASASLSMSHFGFYNDIL